MKSSLNSIFRTIWSEALGAWIAVSEITKTKGKRSSSSLIRSIRPVGAELDSANAIGGRLKPIVFAVACCFALNAQANPLGGQVVNGQANFNNTGNTLTVTNTPGTIINWQGFSINSNEVTHFAQQSAASSVLNRVVTNNPSAILGTLSSNGRVFLVNPSGIFFGAGSTVDVAGLVATSLNLSNADFLAGRHNYTAVAGAQNVSNAGNITTQQSGQVYLIAPNVENTGIINAPNGEILLVAGHSVELVNELDPNLRVNITAPAGDATNIGQLISSAGTLGLFGTVVRNSGVASADSATMQGGKIVFRSSQRTEITGTASAQGAGGGEIKVLSDMQTGTVQVSGTLDASAITVGDGGFIDTSAAHLDIRPTAHIAANATNGKAGEWLIDPLNVTINALTAPATFGGSFVGGVWTPAASGSYISNGTIQGALNLGTNVTITTVNGGFAEAGDINVNASIAKTAGAAASLTLLAENNINFGIGAGISSTSGALNVVLRSDSDANGAGTVTFGGTNTFSLLGGRADLYYNPASYADVATKSDIYSNPYSAVFGATPFTAWMLVNSDVNLQDMNTNLAGNYALGKNIVATATSGWNVGAGFVPVGDLSTAFIGKFDGLGYTISDLTINRPTTNYVGLFGNASSATVSNVTLTNMNISGNTYVGGLVGSSSQSLFNNITVGGAVTGVYQSGGLLGYGYLGSITGSTSSANVTTGVNSNYTGGLVGYNQGGTINTSHATGNVTGYNYVGGLVGSNWYSATVSNSDASGAVVGNLKVGGLVGESGNFSLVTNSHAKLTSTVTGMNQVGGLVGAIGNASVSNSYSMSVVSNAGTGGNYFGGLVGSNPDGSISSSYATGGSVNAGNASDVGGLVGSSGSYWGSTISDSWADINVTGGTNVGGLVGSNVGGGAITAATNGATYALGTVTGINNVGGFVGRNWGSINNASASGAVVIGVNTVGGLVGGNFGTGSITNSYMSNGSVTATRQIGGLVGNAGGVVTNSYYNIDGVTLNGGSLVTWRGLYGVGVSSQYSLWYADGQLTPLVIGTYLTQDVALNYQIGSAQNMRDMLAFADDPAYNFILTGNIDLAAIADPAPGLYVPKLGGSFDGAGNTISNLNISVPNDGVGLFGFTNSAKSISNLTLLNPTVTGFWSVGSLVGNNSANIINSHADNVLVGGNSTVGGLVGMNNGSLTDSYVSTGAVTASLNTIGGLVGAIGGTITNSHFNIDAVTTNGGNNVTATGLYATQFTGWYNGGALTPLSIANYAGSLVLQGDGSYGIGTLQGMKDMIGFTDDPAAYNFSLTGNINLASLPGFMVPKLVGSFNGNGFTLANFSYSLPNAGVGLFCSTSLKTQISNLNLSNASVSGYSFVGALVGENFGNINNTSVTGTSTVSAANGGTAGGLVGQNNGGSYVTGTGTTLTQVNTGIITNSFVNGGTVSSTNGTDVGGLVGYNNQGDITASSVSNTAVSGAGNVGGLVGHNWGVTSWPAGTVHGIITNSFVDSGTVTNTGGASGSAIGGLVGWNDRGDIVGSHAAATVVNGGAASNVGGLVGQHEGVVWRGSLSPNVYSGVINNSYVSGGTVSGVNQVGGLVGINGFIDVPNSRRSGGSVFNSHVVGATVTGTGVDVGGLVGNNFGGLIDLSHVDSVAVTGDYNVGGLVGNDSGEGWNVDLGVISNSYALNTQVTGGSHVGGLVGYIGMTSTSGGNSNNDAIFSSYVDGGTVTSVIAGSSLAALTGVGGLVGYNSYGIISGSYVTGGTVVSGGTASNVGGLVGYNLGSNTGTSSGARRYGAIYASYVNGGTVNGSHAIGGLVGMNMTGTVNGSYVTGVTVTATGNDVGGLVGVNSGGVGGAGLGYGAWPGNVGYQALISNSHVVGGSVSGVTNVGGLIGRNVGGDGGVGGFAATSLVSPGIGGAGGAATILNSYASGGTVTGSSNVGGLVGSNALGVGGATGSGTYGASGGAAGLGDISNSYAVSASVTATSGNVGGLVGFNEGSVFGSYVNGGSIGTLGSGSTVGGLVGRNNGGSISNSYVENGVVGVAPTTSATTGIWMVGGLVGANNNGGNITLSYVSGGTVSGFKEVGGLVGLNINGGSITQSYAASGLVSVGGVGANYVGGLVGWNWADGVVLDSFWDTQTMGQAAGIGFDQNTAVTWNVVGLTTAEMQQQSSFTMYDIVSDTYPVWDFANIWWSADGNTRPFLRSESYFDSFNSRYVISNAHQLQLMNTNLAANYLLANNIDLFPALDNSTTTGMWSNAGFVTIGVNWQTSPFTGNFDGQGFTINHLKITRAPFEGYQGLFAGIGAAGVVSNVGLLNVSISGGSEIGGLAGSNGGTINNSYVSGGSISGSQDVGGLVGFINGVGTINNSYVENMTNVTGTISVGGLVGNQMKYILQTGAINDSRVINTAVIGDRDVGGLVGVVDVGMLVSNSFVIGGSVANAFSSNVGGLVGKNAGQVTGSYRSGGTVTGGANVGGLIGYNIGSIDFSYVEAGASVLGQQKVGGVVGGNSGSISNSFVSGGSVSGGSSVGGLVGNNDGVINGSYVAGGTIVSGWSDVGGLVGYNRATSSTVSGTNTTYFGGRISNSYVDSGAVSATGSNVGGLVGRNLGLVTNSHFNVNAVTTNGGNNATRYGLYDPQYIDWFNGGLLTPLVIGNYLTQQIDLSYGIGSVTDLKNMLAFADAPAAYGFSLTGSIVLDSVLDSGFYVPVLAGTFDGAGSTVSNLAITLPNDNMGLFGEVLATGSVSNLGLLNASVAGNSNVGGLVGWNNGGVINNNYVSTSTISGASSQVGGLVGSNGVGGTISNSYAVGGTVSTGTSAGGGLVGSNEGVIIASHVNGVSVTGSGNVGGLVGWNSNSISDSYVTNAALSAVATTTTAGPAGGLVGTNIGALTNTFVSGGTVTGANAVGGLVGQNSSGSISQSYVLNGSISGVSNVGGLVGSNFAGTGAGGGTGYSFAAGVLGAAGSAAVISQSFVSGGTVSGSTDVGGLVGLNQAGRGGNGGMGYSAVGGVGGVGGAATISDSYVNGVSITATANVGGLVGTNVGGIGGGGGMGYGNWWLGPTGIGGMGGVGGIASISTSYSSAGAVTGTTNVGGLIGNNVSGVAGPAYPINPPYDPTGIYVGQGGAGGAGAVANSFWSDPLVTGIGSNTGTLAGTVAGLDAVQMTTMSTFANAGWDFTNTWRNVDGLAPPGLISLVKNVTVTANNDTQTYNGAAYTTGAGVTYSTPYSSSLIYGTPSYGGTAIGAVNAGSYAITLGGIYSSQYDITFVDGTLVINPAIVVISPLTVKANNASKTYGTTLTFVGTEFTPIGLLNGDNITGVTLSSAGAVNTANAGSYSINVTPGSEVFGQGLASNYTLTYSAGTLTVNPASLTVSAIVQTKIYGDADPNLFSVGGGLASWDTNATAFTGSLSHTGGENVGTYTITQGSLFASANYSLAGFSGNNLLITPALLTVVADSKNKVLGTPDPLLTYMMYGLKLNDSVGTTLNGALDRDTGDTIGTYSIKQGTLALLSSNYTMSYVAGTFRILAPTVVQEITQMTLQSAPAENTAATSQEEEKKESAELLAEATIVDDSGQPLADSLPVCR